MSATNTPGANGNKKTQPQQLQQNGAVNSAQSTPTPQPPNGTMVGPQAQVPPLPSQSTSPPANNAPKYGTLVPNRVFVGGISANTTEGELAQLFSAYGTVKATKIISDRAGVSKGYGFVTFESEEEAKRLQRESDNIMLRERRLNIAPAIKKQPFNKSFDVPSPPPNTATQAQFYYAAAAAAAAAGGVPYAAAYQNGMAYYASPPTTNGDPNGGAQPVYQTQPPVYATPTAAPQAAPYPMPMYPPQPLFIQQQYPYQPIHYDPQQYYGGSQNIGGATQYMYTNGGSNGRNGAANSATSASGTNGGSVAAESGGGSGGTPAPINNSPSNRNHQQHHYHQQQHASSVQQHNAAAAAAATYYAAAAQHLASYNACPQDAAAAAAQLYYNLPLYAIDPAAATASGAAAACYNTDSLVDQLVTAETSSFSFEVHNIAARAQGAPLFSGGGDTHPGGSAKQSYVPVGDRNGYAATASSSSTPQPLSDHKTTHTPVVSLLSVGQANERDYQSMQGGRKHRPPPPINPHDNNNTTAPTINTICSKPQQGMYMLHSHTLINGFNHKTPHHYNHQMPPKSDQCDSNQCRTWAKKHRTYNIASSSSYTETSSVSSLRTSSNSSASAFDENLNEKAPIQYKDDTMQLSRVQYQHPQQHHPQQQYYSSAGNGTRRNRRNNNPNRRQHHQQAASGAATPVTTAPAQQEIGAGDAPVSNEVQDMCKKLDTIKL